MSSTYITQQGSATTSMFLCEHEQEYLSQEALSKSLSEEEEQSASNTNEIEVVPSVSCKWSGNEKIVRSLSAYEWESDSCDWNDNLINNRCFGDESTTNNKMDRVENAEYLIEKVNSQERENLGNNCQFATEELIVDKQITNNNNSNDKNMMRSKSCNDIINMEQMECDQCVETANNDHSTTRCYNDDDDDDYSVDKDAIIEQLETELAQTRSACGVHEKAYLSLLVKYNECNTARDELQLQLQHTQMLLSDAYDKLERLEKSTHMARVVQEQNDNEASLLFTFESELASMKSQLIAHVERERQLVEIGKANETKLLEEIDELQGEVEELHRKEDVAQRVIKSLFATVNNIADEVANAVANCCANNEKFKCDVSNVKTEVNSEGNSSNDKDNDVKECYNGNTENKKDSPSSHVKGCNKSSNNSSKCNTDMHIFTRLDQLRNNVFECVLAQKRSLAELRDTLTCNSNTLHNTAVENEEQTCRQNHRECR